MKVRKTAQAGNLLDHVNLAGALEITLTSARARFLLRAWSCCRHRHASAYPESEPGAVQWQIREKVGGVR